MVVRQKTVRSEQVVRQVLVLVVLLVVVEVTVRIVRADLELMAEDP